MTQLPTMAEFSEQCRQVIAEGKFQKAELGDLDDWSHEIIQQFLTTDNIGWTVVILPVGCIAKISDAFLKYLIVIVGIVPDQPVKLVAWLTLITAQGHDKHSITPDNVLVYLLRRHHENERAEWWSNQN
jgi:hypothetical protein